MERQCRGLWIFWGAVKSQDKVRGAFRSFCGDGEEIVQKETVLVPVDDEMRPEREPRRKKYWIEICCIWCKIGYTRSCTSCYPVIISCFLSYCFLIFNILL